MCFERGMRVELHGISAQRYGKAFDNWPEKRGNLQPVTGRC
jgi:hypothetical protein